MGKVSAGGGKNQHCATRRTAVQAYFRGLQQIEKTPVLGRTFVIPND